MGAAIPFVREKTFERGDGGWDRIVWIHESLKTAVADAIPEEVYDKIATEIDCPKSADLEPFLRDKGHPVTEKYWKDGKPVPLELPAPAQFWPEDMEG